LVPFSQEEFMGRLRPPRLLAVVAYATAPSAVQGAGRPASLRGRWTEPRVPAFSGRWSDADPHLSPDGSKLFFISNRPSSGDSPREEHDIWGVERQARGSWGPPRNLGPPVNRDGATEWSPSVARNARPLDSVNSPKGDFNHSVSPDGKYLFFRSTRGLFDSMPAAPLPDAEMQRRLTGIGNGLGDIYRIPVSQLGILGGD
jgi:hypothetical protein